jgi:hypothetical protein
MLNLVLFGPPGAGKGTQSVKLIEKFDLVHLSTGDIFRANIKGGTEVGILAKSYIDKGQLVPDEVTIGMLASEVNANPSAKGFIFDGFPAIVFSGWPNSSYGTFGGVITVIENGISENGKFRVLVSEDRSDNPWPKQLKFGGGANGIALLKDVSIGYELWRNINGFPPEYYQAKVETKK